MRNTFNAAIGSNRSMFSEKILSWVSGFVVADIKKFLLVFKQAIVRIANIRSVSLKIPFRLYINRQVCPIG